MGPGPAEQTSPLVPGAPKDLHSDDVMVFADVAIAALFWPQSAGRAAFAWVGDVDVFLIADDGALTLLSRRHTLAAEMLSAGLLRGAEPDTPYHHIVTRVLGAAPDVDVDVDVVALGPGERLLLLCSDGLWSTGHGAGSAAHAWLCPLLRAPLAHVAEDIANAASHAGAADNVAVAIVERATE